MGLRARKTFTNGPVRTTISTQGIGWSIGIPGFRIGLAPNGGISVSVGIMGTGVYFTRVLKKSSGNT